MTNFRLGDHEVRPGERRVLTRSGEAAPLGARAFDLLLVLIEHRDRVVGKDELMALVWPGVVVEENNLAVQISAVRKVLGADAIATVPGRGYRLTQPVLLAEPATASPIAQPGETPAHGEAAAADAPPHNLPAERSSFVGREREIERAHAELAEHRLVTLTGIGGAGKTRLALRVAAMELAAFPDGVFFADLAPLVDPELVPRAVAAACGLMLDDSPAGARRTFTDRLVSALASRRCLLVVDNCEHLLDASAGVVERLLAGCAHLAVLATSREALGVEGEQALPVPSLALPDEEAPGVVTDAMRLFADRAHAVQPSFQLDAQTTDVVAEICRRLDGIPLAIEFAAARLSHLSAAQVAERLGDRFRLLTGGRRRIPRQQTLTATLDWSHDLLANAEQTLFRRLAVFNGGFSLAAAEAVCSGEGIGREEVLDLLGSLVGKSLVGVADSAEGAARYRLLETVRLYALDKLDAAGETARLRTRHRDHLLQWLEAMPMETLWFDSAAIDARAVEIDNLRAAFDWCVADGQHALLARMLKPLGLWWGGGFREAMRYLRTALIDEPALARRERVAAHVLLAMMSGFVSDVEGALMHSTRAIDAAANAESREGAAEEDDPFVGLAWIYRGVCQAAVASMPGAEPELLERARRDAHHGLYLTGQSLPRIWLAYGQYLVGMLEMHVHVKEALRWFSECAETLKRKSESESTWIRVAALSGLATARHLLGDVQGARDAALSCLAANEAMCRRLPINFGYTAEVAPALWAGGEEALAVSELRGEAASMQRSGIHLVPNQFLCVAATVEMLRGRPERAGRLFGAARAVGGADQHLISFRLPTTMAIYLHYRPLVQSALGPERARQMRDEGRAMTVGEAFAYALAGLRD